MVLQRLVFFNYFRENDGIGQFKVGSGFSDHEREWENAPRIGSVITYRYFELTNAGKPRFPTFVRVRPSE